MRFEKTYKNSRLPYHAEDKATQGFQLLNCQLLVYQHQTTTIG
jgi:hypothetical protein